MRAYRTTRGIVIEDGGRWTAPRVQDWDALIDGAASAALLEGGRPAEPPAPEDVQAPIGTQEVWAAGVTYYRSRDARMDEAKAAGGSDFYARVYEAARPEIFFKATAARVVGPAAPVRIRADSRWNVPEPELTVAVNRRGEIVGYTVGNDMSSRDIEGENPLYLPQAKVYDGSCALGPCLLLQREPPPPSTAIRLTIERAGAAIFDGSTTLASLKRSIDELVGYLYRETSFPSGCLLMTGTGIIPPHEFSLTHGDVVRITIDPIGTLTNPVAPAGRTAPTPS